MRFSGKARHRPGMWQAVNAEARAPPRARRLTVHTSHPGNKFAAYIADEKWPPRGLAFAESIAPAT
jgi:hypothetical protein